MSGYMIVICIMLVMFAMLAIVLVNGVESAAPASEPDREEHGFGVPVASVSDYPNDEGLDLSGADVSDESLSADVSQGVPPTAPEDATEGIQQSSDQLNETKGVNDENAFLAKDSVDPDVVEAEPEPDAIERETVVADEQVSTEAAMVIGPDTEVAESPIESLQAIPEAELPENKLPDAKSWKPEQADEI